MFLPGIHVPMVGLSEAVIDKIVADGGGGLDLSSLFTSGEKASSARKRVTLPAGRTRGSSSVSIPAIYTGTGWGGIVDIVIHGDADGAGGVVGSPDGGTALRIDQAGVFRLSGTGRLRPGGGLGAKAGNGGAGSQYLVEGPFYQPSGNSQYLMARQTSNDRHIIRWNNSPPATVPGASNAYVQTSPFVSTDGWTYERVAQQADNLNGYTIWSIRRYGTFATSGGVGPNGGRGQGYDGAAANGSGPVGGGANAGASGVSGSGGAFGQNGSAATNGANGNAGSGSAAGAAGLRGFGIQNIANLLSNSFAGTVLGRT